MRRPLLLAVLALATLVPAAAAAERPLVSTTSPTDPSPYVDWPRLLPPAPGHGAGPGDAPDCADGASSCIAETITEMRARLAALGCDHRAVFALAYLRVTEDVQDAAADGVFADVPWLQREDKLFANLYFRTADAWEAGRLRAVPQAWRIAFRAAERRQVGALGNFLLSMNAHINRDFPYTLAGVGIRDAQGRSRKPDHDAYNHRLAALYEPVLAEVARRFDPTTDDLDLGPLDNEAAFALLQGWREVVWRNAERLASARTPAGRRRVERSIEAYAATQGRFVLESLRYRLGASSAARDAHCARQGRA